MRVSFVVVVAVVVAVVVVVVVFSRDGVNKRSKMKCGKRHTKREIKRERERGREINRERERAILISFFHYNPSRDMSLFCPQYLSGVQT